MPDQTNIKDLDLAKPEVQQSIPGLVDELFRRRDAARAVELLRRIVIHPQAESLRRTFDASLPKLVLLVLPLLTADQMGAELDRYVPQLLELDPELLIERLTIAVESLPIKDRPGLKQKLLDQLCGNNSSLTDVALNQANGQTRLPTVGNWAEEILAHRQEAPSAERFLKSRPNAGSFSTEDQQRLGGLVALATFLLTPSTTVEGVEEDIPVGQAGQPVGVLEHGRLEPLPQQPVQRPLVPPKPSPAPKSIAAFYFHPDDEAEIRQHSQRLSSMDLDSSSHEELADVVIDKIIQEQQLNFPDDLLRRRFRTALTAQLKGIRSPQETQDILTRPAKVGGLGFPAQPAARILAAASAEAAKFKDAQGLKKLQEQKEARERQPAAPSPLPSTPVQPLRPPFTPAPAPVRNVPLVPPPAHAIPMPPPKKLPVKIISPRPASADRPLMEDVRQPKTSSRRTVGPTDELEALTPAEFRTYGAEVATAIRKLKSRFDALAKESYALRVQGIVAWRQSPLYQLYLEMGNESMNTRQPISVVAISRQQRGMETLTEQEFKAIADLNRLLRL